MRGSIWLLVLTIGFGCLGAENERPAFEYVDTTDPQEIFEHLDARSVVVIEIEDVAMGTDHMFGSEQWAELRMQELMQGGMTREQARAALTPLWNEILIGSRVQSIDPSILATIRSLQRQGFCVMGITRKDPMLAYHYSARLSRLATDFSRRAPASGHFLVGGLFNAALIDGIFYVGALNEAGPALVELFSQMQYRPSQIVVVSSRLSLLQEVVKAANPRGMPTVGIRLRLADERINGYRPDIAAVQEQMWGKILTEQQAESLLPRRAWFPFW